MRGLLAAIALLSLSSCAASRWELHERQRKEIETYSQKLIGLPVDAAVEWWGAPSSQSQVSSSMVYEWNGGDCRRSVITDMASNVTAVRVEGDCDEM